MRYKGKFVARVTINVDVDANDPNIRPKEEIEEAVKNGELFDAIQEILSHEFSGEGIAEVEPLVSEWRVEE